MYSQSKNLEMNFAFLLEAINAAGLSDRQLEMVSNFTGMELAAIEDLFEQAESIRSRALDGTYRRVGSAHINTGQLVITDPANIDAAWKKDNFQPKHEYKILLEDGKEMAISVNDTDFDAYHKPIEEAGGRTLSNLIDDGIAKVSPGTPATTFSMNGAIQQALSPKAGGELFGEHCALPLGVAVSLGGGKADIYLDHEGDGSVRRAIIEIPQEA